METMTVKEFREAMRRTCTAIVPVGLMEQHGYHLPLNTDTLFVLEPLQRIADRIQCVIAPVLSYCFSGGELPGTINVNPSLYSQLVCDIARSLFQSGFRNVVVLVAHAGSENIQALRAEMTNFLRLHPHLEDRNLFLVMPHSFIRPETLAQIYGEGDQKDFHAGMAETSLMLYWRPDLVRMAEATVDEEPYASRMRTDPDWYAEQIRAVDTPFTIPWIRQRPGIRVGVMGFPKKASAAFGERLSREMEEGMLAFLEKIDHP